MSECIFLKEVPYGNSYIALIHEAAHWRHFELDMRGKNLSELWQREFPIVIPDGIALSGIRPDSETAIAVMTENGILNFHATLDYNIESPVSRYGLPVNLPEAAPVSKNEKDSIVVEFYPPYKSPVSLIAFRLAYRGVAELPAGLGEYVKKVCIFPELNYSGAFSHSYATQETHYNDVAEDIATSTEHLITASRNPWDHHFVHSQLANNPQTRRRLEALVEFGFVEKDAATRLMREARKIAVSAFAEAALYFI